MTLTDQQRALLRKTMLAQFTADEQEMLIAIVERTGLDPFSRQIYATPRWDKAKNRYVLAIVVSIDGFRVIAERTGQYVGQLGPYWCGADGNWKRDANGLPLPWLAAEPPKAAMVGACRGDFAQPLYAVARWDSYVQMKDGKPTRFWSSMPDLMIGKVAEALALRRAFPQQLSGLYTTEELAQDTEIKHDAAPHAAPKPEPPPPKPATPSPPEQQPREVDPDYERLRESLHAIGCAHKGEADAVVAYCLEGATLDKCKSVPGMAKQVMDKLVDIGATLTGDAIIETAMAGVAT